MKTDTFSNQLRWVILLLATAVILPTVCLLWFMNQAVKNERLAVRTKLIDVYQKQYEFSRREHLDDDWIRLNISLPAAEGILVYDSNDVLTFPVPAVETLADSDLFTQAATFEFQETADDKALEEYTQIAENSAEPHILMQAQISQARCLSKLDRRDEAIERLKDLLSNSKVNDIVLRSQKCRVFLLLLELTHNADGKEFENTLSQDYDFLTQGMADDSDLQFLGEADYLQHAIPSALQVFALQKFVDYANTLPPNPALQKKIKRAGELESMITVALEVAQDYPQPDFVDSPTIVSSAVFCFKTQKPYYGCYRRARGYIRTLIFGREHFAPMLNPLIDDIRQMPAECIIYDENGQQVAGTQVPTGQSPFVIMPVSDWLPGWSAHLYVQDATIENFAKRQAIIYTWAGILVIGFILLSGGVAATAILRQQKINRLKNDFIATVTHELKTPLSSMRLLVDTLLEKRYDDEKTATEYLQMVANENKRLTHLIDSFLTFSRMERNKQVFDFQCVWPREIVTDAVEAMQAKLSGDDCHFVHSVDDDLPALSADKDAMVTVLVNLLDNAYKYTNADKQIELNVYQQDGCVCFAVKDNGIGLNPRARKKIFNRFYQVDSRLSRSVEGCGLGLSIVRFIVDAHKGKIEVESTPCKGSIFIIKLPTSSSFH